MAKNFKYEDFKKKIRDRINRPAEQTPARPLLATLKSRVGGMRKVSPKLPEIK